MDKISKLLEDVFGVKPIVVNDENKNIADILKDIVKEYRTREMINDVEETANHKHENTDDLRTTVYNYAIALSNVLMFDKDDAKSVGLEDVKRLAKNFEIIQEKFNKLACEQIQRFNDIIKDLSSDTGSEDLSKLTKEELIAILREKNK